MCAEKCFVLHFPDSISDEHKATEVLFGTKDAMGIGIYAITRSALERGALVIVTLTQEFSLKQLLVRNLHQIRCFPQFRGYDENEVAPLFGPTLSRAQTLLANDEEDMFVRSIRHALDRGATEIVHVVPPEALARRRELLDAFMGRTNIPARLCIETSPSEH
jgi:hypothetical protein